MHTLSHTFKELGWRRIMFSLVVLAYVGFLMLITVLMFLPVLGWLPDNALSAMGHFETFLGTGETHDLIHELVFALLVGTAAVGLFSQLWKPKENVVGQWVALVVWIVMIVTAAFTNNWVPQPLFIIFGGLTLLATILHPAGRGLFNWFRTAQINRVLLALVIIATAPLFMLAFTNLSLQTAGDKTTGFFGHTPPVFHSGDSATNQELSQDKVLKNTEGTATVDKANHDQKHIALGHYRNIAAFTFIIILIGVLASFRPKKWRLAAWIAGVLPIIFGFASAVLPEAESSIGVSWGIATIVWGSMFLYCRQ